MNSSKILNAKAAVDLIQGGGIVAFGTETVYGLGANSLDPVAVAKVFEAKQRPSFDPLIVHLSSSADVQKYVTHIPRVCQQLIDAFWPGPLTVVLPKRETIPDLVTSGLPRVALRVPAHEQAREFIQKCGVPIAAPSANRFGCLSPTTAQHVLDGLGDSIDGVLDFGPCRVGVESTVVAFDELERVVLLRPGGISLEEIESVVGSVEQFLPTDQDDDNHPQAAPGMLKRHYAPSKDLEIVETLAEVADPASVGLLSLKIVPDAQQFAVVETLSEPGDFVEAAANFFAAMRRLETSSSERIVAVRFPDVGLGRALNDRLTRAAKNS